MENNFVNGMLQLKCKHCNGVLFQEYYTLFLKSRLSDITVTNDYIVPAPVFMCVGCGQPYIHEQAPQNHSNIIT